MHLTILVLLDLLCSGGIVILIMLFSVFIRYLDSILNEIAFCEYMDCLFSKKLESYRNFQCHVTSCFEVLFMQFLC
jgi:hypothetical protein